MRALLALAVAGSTLGAGPAAAEVVPHIEAGVAQTGEALTVPAGDGALTETRDLYSTRLAIGLDYPALSEVAPLGGALYGRTALAGDVLLTPGRWSLVAEQDLRWRRPLGPLSIALGLGLAARLELERPSFSTLALGLPVGVRWGWLELDWRPAWRIPLGEEEAAVFGGTRRHGAVSGVDLLALALRVHVTALAW